MAIAQGALYMQKGLHLVFGGELTKLGKTKFKDIDAIDIVGIFPAFESARKAWKNVSQREVDNAHYRYFVAHLHKLRDEEIEKPIHGK